MHYKILANIKKFLIGWKPYNIFYTTSYVSYNYGDPFAVPTYFYEVYNYTKLGNWFEDMPIILSTLKLLYYIPAWCINIIFAVVWFVIELFLPKKVKNLL